MHLLRTLARGGVSSVTRPTIVTAVPLVTAGAVLTPDNGRAWEVLSLTATLVTDSNAANRSVTLQLSDGTHVLWTLEPVAVQAASTTVVYSWIFDYPTPIVTTIGGTQAQPLPPTILVPGWTLTTTIGNHQVGDQFTAGIAQVLETFVGRTEAEYNLARSIAHHADAIGELLTGEVVDV